MKKVLFGLATMAFSGTALSATFQYTLVSLATGSSNGSAAAALAGGVDYTYDTASPGELNKTTVGGTGFYTFFAVGRVLQTYAVEGLTVGNGVASATAYSCIEGSFGVAVGANICGNYTLGANMVDESSYDYSTVPGTRTLNDNPVPGTGPSSDDVAAGPLQQAADMACTIVSGTAGVSNLVCENAAWNSDGVDDSGNPFSTDGMQFMFSLVPDDDTPMAVDDGTMGNPAFMVPVGATQDLDVLANDSGLNDTPLTISITTNGIFGTAANAGPGDATTPVSYMAGAVIGVDSFVYEVMDNDGDTSSATSWVAVTDADIPMAFDDADTTGPDTTVSVNVLANDTGLTGTPLTVTIQTSPGDGTIGVISGCDQQATCQVPYTPNMGFIGTDTFEYFVTDTTLDMSNIATVTITVSDLPDAADDVASTVLGTSTNIDVLDNDTGLDAEPLTVTISTPPIRGSAVVEDDNTITFTPGGTDKNIDIFQYTVTDDNGESSSAQVTVTVDRAAEPPVQDTLPGKNTAVGPLSLLALLFAPLLRLRRRLKKR